jgi:hypothetical protein
MKTQLLAAAPLALLALSQTANADPPAPEVNQAIAAPAQTPIPLPGPVATTTAPAPNKPLFYVLGVPVRLSAPVPPPYGNGAYTTFAGQPASGQDVILMQDLHN